jgi:hypothetical protein
MENSVNKNVGRGSVRGGLGVLEAFLIQSRDVGFKSLVVSVRV